MTELILEINELVNKNIAFIALKDNIDFSTPVGRLQFNILGSIAEFEREIIRQRTLEGLARAKSQGKKLGRPHGSKDRKKRSSKNYILKEERKRLLKHNSKSSIN